MRCIETTSGARVPCTSRRASRSITKGMTKKVRVRKMWLVVRQIYLKREDLNHTGAHKINNSLGQVLLCKRMGKKRVIAETGAGQHGCATVRLMSDERVRFGVIF